MSPENPILRFFPQDVEPSEELLQNERCSRIPIAWVLSGCQAHDAAQWLVDACAYQEIEKGNEISAICTGYAQLQKILCSVLQISTEEQQNQLSQMLADLCKVQLAALLENAADFPPLSAVSEIRNSAAELIFGQGINETHLFFSAALAHNMPSNWLTDMAQAQLKMYATFDDSEAEELTLLWQQLQDTLLPEALQTAAFVENVLYHTCVSLTLTDPENADVWSTVTGAFVNTIQIKEDEQ